MDFDFRTSLELGSGKEESSGLGSSSTSDSCLFDRVSRRSQVTVLKSQNGKKIVTMKRTSDDWVK